MPVVPKAKLTVPLSTPTISTPTIAPISTPRVIPGAFGADVARANQALGDVGFKIAEHLEQLALDNQNKEIIEKDTAWRKETQNLFRSQELESYKDKDGKEQSRSKGYLLRQLGQAKGSTDEFTEQYETDIRGRYLKGLNGYQADKLSARMDDYFLSMQNKLITHEANQNNEDFRNSTEGSLEQTYLDASAIADPVQLNETIDKAIADATPYYSKFDKASQELKREEISGKIINSATTSMLASTADLEGSTALLDSAKDKISPLTYDAIKSKLTTGYKSMKSEIEAIRKINRIADRHSNITDVANGKINWKNAESAILAVARNDPKLAEAMEKNIRNGKYKFTDKASKKTNKAFLKLSNSIFESNDEEVISDFLVTALSDTVNISRERLGILVYGAKKRGEEIAKKQGGVEGGFWRDFVGYFKSQSTFGQVDSMINTLEKAQTENASDERVKELAEEEVDKVNARDREDVLKLNDENLEPKEIPTFNSIAEGNAANLPVGSKVIINGKTYIMK